MSSHADTIREIAAQSERWARYDDVMAPGLDAAQKLREAADALDALLAENQRLEMAYRQACTNLATIRPSGIGGATIGDDADRYHDALLAGWGGIEGWDSREALAGDAE